MADILAGRHVTAKQFFDAVRCTEAEQRGDDNIEIYDLKKMSYALLQKRLYQVNQARRSISHQMRRGGIIDGLNAEAKAICDEMVTRY